MNESIKKMYEQEPKTWYAKIIVALIVAALLAWSLSTVQSTGSNGSGLSVADHQRNFPPGYEFTV